MRKEQFNDLLTDLYTAYNSDYIKYIPSLVEKNHGGLEVDAVMMIFMKYNHSSAAHYDPVKSTDQFAIDLVNQYSNGKRTLKDWSLKQEAERRKNENAENAKQQTEEEKKKEKDEADAIRLKAEAEVKRLSDLKSGIGEQVKSKLEETTQKFAQREKEIFDKYEKKIEELEKKLSEDKNIEILIHHDYKESELKIPNKTMLRSLGIGTRMIVENIEGKPIGMHVIDIVYDAVSHPEGITVIEITLERR